MEQKQKTGKSRRKLHLLGALALVLALTGGMFAYTYTTANIALGMTAQSDIASVAPTGYNAGGAGGLYGKVFGKYKGDLPEGNLFSIDPDDEYTGDLTVKVSIMNPGELAHAYQYFNMKLALTNASGAKIIGSGGAPSGHEYQSLNLENGAVEFDVAATVTSQPYYIKLVDGGYATHGQSPLPWTSPVSVNPELFCEVVAR